MKKGRITLPYSDSVITFQLQGILAVLQLPPQVAAEFLTNVPLAATPYTQSLVYVVLGPVVNIAFM